MLQSASESIASPWTGTRYAVTYYHLSLSPSSGGEYIQVIKYTWYLWLIYRRIILFAMGLAMGKGISEKCCNFLRTKMNRTRMKPRGTMSFRHISYQFELYGDFLVVAKKKQNIPEVVATNKMKGVNSGVGKLVKLTSGKVNSIETIFKSASLEPNKNIFASIFLRHSVLHLQIIFTLHVNFWLWFQKIE